MLKIGASPLKISKTVGTEVFLESILCVKRTDIRKYPIYLFIFATLTKRLSSLAYDRGWRMRTDWKQYQLLKQ
jgi:hypothetical protein